MNYFLRPTRCRCLTRLPAACTASGGGYPLLSRWFSAQKQNIDSFSSLPACQSHNSSFPHMIFQASFGTEAIILCILVPKNYSELFFSITFLRIPVFHGREFLIFMLLYLLSPKSGTSFLFPRFSCSSSRDVYFDKTCFCTETPARPQSFCTGTPSKPTNCHLQTDNSHL